MKPLSAGLAALALLVAACGSTADVAGQYGTPEVLGAALATLQDNSVDPASGLPAPAVDGADFGGSPVSIDPTNGNAKILLFVAHWCPHCQSEVPAVQGYLDQHGMTDGVDFISVATSTDPARPNYPPQAWLEREGWEVPVIVDDEARTVANAYGLSAFPFWVIVDADGTVLQRVAGSIDVAALPGLMEQLSR